MSNYRTVRTVFREVPLVVVLRPDGTIKSVATGYPGFQGITPLVDPVAMEELRKQIAGELEGE